MYSLFCERDELSLGSSASSRTISTRSCRVRSVEVEKCVVSARLPLRPTWDDFDEELSGEGAGRKSRRARECTLAARRFFAKRMCETDALILGTAHH